MLITDREKRIINDLHRLTYECAAAAVEAGLLGLTERQDYFDSIMIDLGKLVEETKGAIQ